MPETTTTTRRAACSCGAFSIEVRGEPVRVSVCHCYECQPRTGSAFGVQARFRDEDVVAITGPSTSWSRTGDEGGRATFQFCPTCGSTVIWRLDAIPGFVVVAVGAFRDRSFPSPKVAVYEERAHPFLHVSEWDVEHWE